jgi:Peptidase family M28/PA domain
MRFTKRLPLAVLCSLALAQSAPDAVSVRRLRADVEFLSSNPLEGRVSLGRGADVAALYIAAEFQSVGLAPGAGTEFLQQFPLIAYEPDRKATRLRVARNGKTVELQEGQDFRGGYWLETKISAPLVFAGYGITAPEYGYDDYAGIDARGKVVLIFDHEPRETDPKSVFNGGGHTRHANSRVKVENARRHGAVAVLLASEPLRKHAGPFDAAAQAASGQPLRANAPRQAIQEDSIPLIQLSDRAAAELLGPVGKTPAELQADIDRNLRPASTPLSNTVVELRTVAANSRRGQSANVVGLLEGSDPALRGETVLITAHYDHLGVQNGHLYPGANDNASGTAGVMELARLFTASTRPRRSLLFVVFGSEEEGLLGSYYYVAHPLRPLGTTRAVLNLDMIARDEAHIPQSRGVVEIPADTTNEINLVGVFYSPDLRAAILKANERIGLEVSDKFDRDHDLNALFRCDHFPFLLHDVPAAWFFGGWHPGYHEPSDTIEKLNFSKFEKVLRLAYWSARSIADSDTTPRFQP